MVEEWTLNDFFLKMFRVDCMDQKFEIIVKILTKLIEKHQNIHTMGRFSEKTSMKYFENHIFTMWDESHKNLYHQIGSYQLCMTLFRKIKIASDRINEMRRTKDQKLSTLNLLFLGTI
jgi:hypothetical protein